MYRVVVCAIAAVVFAAGRPAMADSVSVCATARGDDAIAACTRLIEGPAGGALELFLHNRGTAWYRKHDYDRAIADFDQAIALAPNMAVNYDSRGKAYDAKGDNDRAIADFDQAIRINPGDPAYYSNRADLHAENGDDDQAIADYGEAIRLDPDNATPYRRRAELYSTQGDNDRAIADYDHAIRIDPNDASLYASRAIAYRGKRDWDRVILDYDHAIGLDPRRARFWHERGYARLDSGDYGAAIADFDAALKLDPSRRSTQWGRERARHKLVLSRLSPVLAIANFVVAFLVAFGWNRLGLVRWRRSADLHWTERARLLYPERVYAAARISLIPLCLGAATFIAVPDANFVLVVSADCAALLLAAFFFDREVFPSVRAGPWLRTLAAHLMLRSQWVPGLVLAAVLAMPPHFGGVTWLLFGAIVIVLLAELSGLGIRLLTWFRILLPADERLRGIVAQASEKMKIPVAAAWILPSFGSNAYAAFHTREVIFTDRLLSTLPYPQISVVCAHELQHFKDARKATLVRVLVMSTYAAATLMRPVFALKSDLPNVLLMVLTFCLLILAMKVLTARLLRRMEERADRAGVENQVDQGIYAAALARMYETNQMPAVMPRGSLRPHPDLYDRMLAAGVTPDFPKPLPPGRRARDTRGTPGAGA